MDSIHNFGTFLISCLLLNITPGSDTVLVLSRSIAGGTRAGVYTVLGIGAGCIGHTMLAAFGLSIVVAKSIVLFEIIKYAGAAYIIYIGVRMIVSPSIVPDSPSQSRLAVDASSCFRDGFLTNILNPKVALFFIAFLPQFVDPAAQGGAWPFILLGFTFVVTGTIYCTGLAVFAARVFSGLRSHKGFSTWLNRTCGSVLILLGAYVAVFRR